MIKLNKSQIPHVLANNAATWLEELQQAIIEGDKKKIASKKARYNHSDIKSAVAEETCDKCAYCEADVRAVSHGDIEHVFPKSLDVDRTFQWENLGFSCQVCNQSKSDKDPNFERIIDPYNVDPQPYLFFVGPFLNSQGTIEGRQTIHHLSLNRTALVERRLTVMKSLNQWMELIETARSPAERTILIEDFQNSELNRELEFSAMRRDFWKVYKHEIEDSA